MPASYTMTFDPATFARLRTLTRVAPIFTALSLAAMNACVNKVRTEAVMLAPVGSFGAGNGRTGTGGTLRRGITGQVRSPWEGVVGVGHEVPYARRREFGFSGMTDALGRFYPNDPGAMYLHGGLDASRPFIVSAFRTAAQLAVQRVALATI